MRDNDEITDDVVYESNEESAESHDDIVPEDEGEEDAAASIKKLRDKLKACQAEKQTYLEGWQRSKADYINLKKTHEEDRKEIMGFATERIIQDFLTVADSFEMAFANKQAWSEVPENWRKGVEYIYNQLEGTFRNHGLEEIQALGKPFDPKYHHAVATIAVTKEAEDHMVMEVVKKGYILQQKVIRPAQVKVGEFKA